MANDDSAAHIDKGYFKERFRSAPNQFIDQPLKAPTTGRLAVFRGQTAQTFRGDETLQIRDFFGTADQKPLPILDRPDELRRLAALCAILGFSSLALPLNAAQLRR